MVISVFLKNNSTFPYQVQIGIKAKIDKKYQINRCFYKLNKNTHTLNLNIGFSRCTQIMAYYNNMPRHRPAAQ